MQAGIIGFGLMGERRARNIRTVDPSVKLVVFDPDGEKLKAKQAEFGYEIASDWKDIIARKDVDFVVIAVPHHLAAEIAIAAASAGKDTLCEKPIGITLAEVNAVEKAVAANNVIFDPGFNFRFYPGVQTARERIANGAIGTVTHARLTFGHGGRRGMEKEWKMMKRFAGGGALLDPGIHGIDLARFLFGDVVQGTAQIKNAFWKTDVEDVAMVTLTTANNVLLKAHFSTSEWKSLFRFEIFGTDGYCFIEGKGGNYGPQVVRIGTRWFFENNTPEEVIEYGSEDNSYLEEVRAFMAVRQGKPSATLATIKDGVRATEIVDSLYTS